MSFYLLASATSGGPCRGLGRATHKRTGTTAYIRLVRQPGQRKLALFRVVELKRWYVVV